MLAVKVSDDEIETATGSPDLYDGLQSRIAARRKRRAGERSLADRAIRFLIPALLGPQRSARWTLTTAAMLLLVAMALLFSLPKRAPEETRLARPVAPRVAPSPTPAVDSGQAGSAVVVSEPPAQNRQRRPFLQRQLTERRSDEVATDFLPLTFSADSTPQVSGHLVRVTVPRSALVAMGLPMNAERASELVRADVFIGDDGLARAIRFIQ